MVKFYLMLLNDGVAPGEERVISGETIKTLTTRQHEGLLDETFGVVMDRGLGFFIDSRRHSPRFPMDTVLLRHQRRSGMAAKNLQQDLLIPKNNSPCP